MGKKNNKKIQKQNRKWLWIAIVAAVVVIAAAVYGIYAHNYNNRDHAEKISDDQLKQYNYTLTVFGRNKSMIGDKDVLVVDTIAKELGGDTQITFVIYRYTNESDLARALEMTKEEIAQDAAFEYMGNGTVTMVNDEIAGMSNMRTTYIK